MIRRILSAATLAAVTAATAQAQVSAVFHASNTGDFYDNAKGVFTSGAAGVGGNFVNNSTFQIWCVDQQHTANFSNYDVYASKLDGSMSKTRVGNSDTYAKAAFIASGMNSSMTGAQESASQYAIWAIIHGRTAAVQCSGSNDNVSGLAACNSTAVGTAMGLATAASTGYTTIDKSEWYVISDQDAWIGNYYISSWGGQEFLARCQSAAGLALGSVPTTPNCDGFVTTNAIDPTPEPATMSLIALGLAGMAGKSLRRRKKQ